MKDVTATTSLLRPPIVAVLGHVDHGKTSLLDAIRSTNVTAREAGGITQSIGASSITTKDGKKITFIDTPGHATFSQMRSRGAKTADIVVLVCAADDGAKPQTLEALEHIRTANVAMIVAFTKIDLPSASVENAQASLEKQGVYFENRGGDVPWVAISSKTGQGIDELLELINLMAEVNEISADPKAPLEAVIIETAKDKRGQLASAIVRNGTLSVGDEIVTDGMRVKIKGIFDENGNILKSVAPGEAGQLLGFTEVPTVGAILEQFDAQKTYTRTSGGARSGVIEVKEGELPIFLKTKTAGSLEALLTALPHKVAVVGSSVGDVNESDVLFAKSANAAIFCFEAKVPTTVSKLAETEGVKIETFRIIYELIAKLEELLKKDERQISGKAEILASFPYERKKVAGCKVLSGVIKRSDKLLLMSGEKEIGIVKITSMRRMKNDLSEAKPGEELGIIFEPQLAFGPGDVLLSIG